MNELWINCFPKLTYLCKQTSSTIFKYLTELIDKNKVDRYYYKNQYFNLRVTQSHYKVYMEMRIRDIVFLLISNIRLLSGRLKNQTNSKAESFQINEKLYRHSKSTLTMKTT